MSAMANLQQLSLDDDPPAGDPVARICIGIQREIDDRVGWKALILSRKCVNEELPLIVTAIRYVKQEVSLARKEYAPQHLRAVIRSLEPHPLCYRQVQLIPNHQFLRPDIPIYNQVNTFGGTHYVLVVHNGKRVER